jgi:hypothetical protein
MPAYQGLVSEEGLLELIEYVKSLKSETPSVRPNVSGPAAGEATPARGAEGRQ